MSTSYSPKFACTLRSLTWGTDNKNLVLIMSTEKSESALLTTNVIYLCRNFLNNSGSMGLYNRLHVSQFLLLRDIVLPEDSIKKSTGITYVNSHLVLLCGGTIYFRMATGKVTPATALRCDELY